MEADKLKADPRTKLLAVGTINSGVDVTELNNVASPPLDMNVILIYDASNTLGFVLEQIINASCNGPYSFLLLLLLFIIYFFYFYLFLFFFILLLLLFFF